jgi:hypothetical protein
MNLAINATNPDGKSIAERAGELAEQMERWQRQYRQLGADMGVTFAEINQETDQ